MLGANGREFKKVFAGAQKQLRATFGMEMVELPTKDRNLMTTEQRRKGKCSMGCHLISVDHANASHPVAAKSQSQKETSSNTFVLVSLLPEEYSTPEILVPSKVHSADGEASYMALYTTIIAIITLSGGELSDPRLRRHLTRLNAADNMPSLNPNDGSSPTDKTDAVLQKMIKQGYLIKVSEARAAGDEDSTIWHVGPRGKVEVDKEVLAAFVRTIYGGSNPELEQKLQVSLKIRAREPGMPEVVEDEAEEAPPAGDPRPSTRRRGRRRQTEAEEENSE